MKFAENWANFDDKTIFWWMNLFYSFVTTGNI